MIWFTSDLHLEHNNIIRFCGRPYTSKSEMNEILIQNWNKKIKPTEHVYFLGDFCFKGVTAHKKFISRLNGRKIIILGNHDKAAHRMLEFGFQEAYESLKLRIGNYEVYLSHYPYHPMTTYNNWQGHVQMSLPEHVDQRRLYKRLIDDGKTWLLCGHVHEKWKFKGRMINVGVDVWNFSPVCHEQIVSVIKRNDRG